MARELFVDIENQTLIRDPASGVPISPNNLFEGDSPNYELYFVRPGVNGAPPYQFEDFSARSVKLHVGPNPPTTATAYVAAEAWTTASGSVVGSVTRTSVGGPGINETFTITLDPRPNGGSFAIGFPQRTITVSALATRLGGGFGLPPFALGTNFYAVAPHGLGRGDVVTLTGFTTPSGFSNGDRFFVLDASNTVFGLTANLNGSLLTLTAASPGQAIVQEFAVNIAAPASAQSVQNALFNTPFDNANAGNFVVGELSAPTEKVQRLSVVLQNNRGKSAYPLVTVATTAAEGRPHKTSAINFNTVELTNAISGSATLDATLEIQTQEGGNTETVLQMPVTLKNDLIATGSPLPVSTTTASAFALLTSPDNSVFAVSVDDSGILTTEKLS
jgi:hypothetical protein